MPTCPAWSLTQLVEHIGQTHRFMTAIVGRRITGPEQLPTSYPELPAAQDAWAGWLRDGAEQLAAAFTDAGIDADVWNPSGDSRSGTRFWLHRAVAETVIHRADATATAGEPYELDADLAAAVVTDQLDMLTSPGWAAAVPQSAEALRGTGQTLRLVAEEGGEWRVERRPEGATWRPGSGADADVTVSGPAATIMRVLTRRLPVGDAGDLRIDGERDLLVHWVDNTAHVAG